ncbi:MAG: tyrosine-type recombinase/integrase [Lachnospiraceae bacterium]
MRESEYLFITLSGEHAGQALTEDAVNAMLRRLQRKTQIKVTSHMLRHYFCKRASEEWMEFGIDQSGAGA